MVLLGLVSYGGLAVDLLPDIGTPRITLITRAQQLRTYGLAIPQSAFQYRAQHLA